MIVMVLVLMPIAAIVVSNGGWVGKAMETYGWPDAPEKAKSVFVLVMKSSPSQEFLGSLSPRC